MTTPTITALTAHCTALEALVGALREAHDFQWTTPPRVPRSHLEEARPSGRVSDPTANIALNERRLAVRGAVAGAEFALAASASFDVVREQLEQTLAPYRGEDADDVLAALGVAPEAVAG